MMTKTLILRSGSEILFIYLFIFGGGGGGVVGESYRRTLGRKTK
jgi:hypothetical protein